MHILLKVIVFWVTEGINGLLGDFEDPEESQSPEGWQAKIVGPFIEVNPKHLQDRASDDYAIEPTWSICYKNHLISFESWYWDIWFSSMKGFLTWLTC